MEQYYETLSNQRIMELLQLRRLYAQKVREFQRFIAAMEGEEPLSPEEIEGEIGDNNAKTKLFDTLHRRERDYSDLSSLLGNIALILENPTSELEDDDRKAIIQGAQSNMAWYEKHIEDIDQTLRDSALDGVSVRLV